MSELGVAFWEVKQAYRLKRNCLTQFTFPVAGHQAIHPGLGVSFWGLVYWREVLA